MGIKLFIVRLFIWFIVALGILSCSSTQMNEAIAQKDQGQTGTALRIARDSLEVGQEESVRLDAANLIGQIGKDRTGDHRNTAGKTLMAYLDDTSLVVKNTVIYNLGKMQFEPATKKLRDMARDSNIDPETLEEINYALQSISKKTAH